jgi:hypothetical protein
MRHPAIVNEVWRNAGPSGSDRQAVEPKRPWRTIVGVVHDAKEFSVDNDAD